jgi:hypothetical protein
MTHDDVMQACKCHAPTCKRPADIATVATASTGLGCIGCTPCGMIMQRTFTIMVRIMPSPI